MPFSQEKLENISKLFHKTLFESDEGVVGREFIKKRGLNPQKFISYEVGFCPPDILYPDENKFFSQGHLWYMRGRLIFTIRNLAGDIIGFNGRVIPDCSEALLESLKEQCGNEKALQLHEKWGPRKWVNEEFIKGHMLFQLYNNHKKILEKKSAILVEGCMDAVVMNVFGIQNCVSSLGTSVTAIQRSLLKRFTDHLIFCFDADMAGEKARSEIMQLYQENDYGTTTSAIILNNMDPEDALLSNKESSLFLSAIHSHIKTRQDQRVTDLRNNEHRSAISINIT